MLTRLLFLTAGILFFSITQAASLEKQISNYVIQQKNEQLSLLEKLVNINSGTTNLAGIYQVGEILQPQFEKLGFKTYWVKEPPEMHRAATLIAERKGSKGKKLLLIGHLDTVFPKNSPFQQFGLHGKMATGPGIIDDKGGDVVILYALKALHSIHALDDTTITVVLTGDEENAGKPTAISRKPLFGAAKNSDIALDFEWAITPDTATIARRGISHWQIKTEGVEAHSSVIFQKNVGYGAIFELTRILNTMCTELSKEKYLTLNPEFILGGDGRSNVVAKNAMAKGDLRFLTSEQKENAEKKILNIVEQHLGGTTATVYFQDGIPSMPSTPANLKLLEKYSEVSRALGHGAVKPLDPGARGAGDISHIAQLVSANLAGLGALGTGAHSTKETLDIESLSIQTQRAAMLIYQLTRGI